MRGKNLPQSNPQTFPTNACAACVTNGRCILNGVDPESLLTVQSIRGCHTFKKGESIPTGALGEAGLHVIKQGKVKVSRVGRKTRAIYIDGPGDLLGIGDAGREGTTAAALEHVETCYFPQDEFMTQAAKSPRLLDNLLSYFWRKLRKSATRISGLENITVKARVAHMLCTLVDEHGTPSDLGTKISIDIDRGTLAELASTVKESLSRALSDLEEAGIIRREGWSIHVVDRKRLEDVAET